MGKKDYNLKFFGGCLWLCDICDVSLSNVAWFTSQPADLRSLVLSDLWNMSLLIPPMIYFKFGM